MENLQKHLSDSSLRISKLPEKGRCLFTTRDFSPGEVIISENPYISVSSKTKESPKSKCEWCFSSVSVKKCSGCKFVCYCGSSCQKLDWRLHSVECQKLSELSLDRLKSLTSSLRLMLRLCIRRKLEIEEVYPTTASENYKNVEALVSHFSKFDEKRMVLYAQMADLVHIIHRSPESEISIKEVAENFSKLACNAHTICDCELNPLGTGLYPVVSIINHSCAPNSVLVFDGRLAVVRAMQRIPKGTEVSISYIDTAGSTVTRRKALKDQYFFTCHCSRCVNLGEADDIRESAVLEGYRCKDGICNGYLIRDSGNQGFICQSCGRLRDEEEIKELEVLLEKAVTTADKAKAGPAYNKLVEDLQMKLYHPFSVSLMRTRETLLKIFMEVQDWEQALSYCRLILPVYEVIYSRFHPLLGLQYYCCGKIEWLLGETEAAIRSLTKAWDILRITHGTKTGFTAELVGMLEEARAYALHSKV
ncbi:hypothetical protein M569_01616, partial [Genlisea aurea]